MFIYFNFYYFNVYCFYSTDLGSILSLSEIRKHKQNNSILEQKIKEQDEEIKLLLDNIISIKNRDENLENY